MNRIEADIAAIARISSVPTILRVISEITGLRLALVARVTQESWTACAVLDQMDFGLEVGGQLDVATTLCSVVRDTERAIIIEHASQDPDFCGHPTPKLYGFESYISLPIYRADGEYFGNVCALDPAPARLRDEKTVATIQLFAELISKQLVAEEESARDREALARERETAELREQFIAVLGHDLRNPLSSIVTGSEFLLELPLGTTERTILRRIRSSGDRMARLIDDVLDFARGRMGGGMPLHREEVEVATLVGDVVGEIASAHPDRTVRIELSAAGTAWVDRSRMAQLLSNVVANAAQYSTRDEPVDVAVRGATDEVVVAVTNVGEPIPADLIPRLFDPYVRAERNTPRVGLGLGLFIADEIARAHGGSIDAESTQAGRTTFTLRLPRARPVSD